ncbi:MAG: MaoC family dehydratase N-terminal domain-containing protein [Dehalococcoidia bacterium]
MTSVPHELEPGTRLFSIELDEVQLEHLVRWAGAVDDYEPLHYDERAAAARGLDGPVVHGPWKASVLARALVEAVEADARITQLTCHYRRPDFVGDRLTFQAEVTEVIPRHDDLQVECAVRVIGEGGMETVVGGATLMLPRKNEEHCEGAQLVTQVMLDRLNYGQEAGRFTYRIQENDLERFHASIGPVDELDPRPSVTVSGGMEVAPPTYYMAIDPVERRDLDIEGFVYQVPYPIVGGGNAFNEVEYERPIVVGDLVTVSTSFTEVYEKVGRSGQLLFRVRSNVLTDLRDEVIARSRMGHAIAYDLSERNMP